MPDLDRHVIYSPTSRADIGAHVFPIEKYRLVYERLVAENGLAAHMEPVPASDEELLTVHSRAYLDDLASGHHTWRTQASELPLSAEIVTFFRLACGGTLLAARTALEAGWAAHLGGGFHHAFRERAEGFCYLNDLAVTVRVVQRGGAVDRVAVIDLDVHQGNGTAAVFAGDSSVFTMSVHQEDNYPIKERSDLDVSLLAWDPRRRGSPMVTDDLYLDLLHPAVDRVLDGFAPDLVLYQAGADPYEDDQLGGFRLTLEGLRRRDQVVMEACVRRGVPLAVTLGGGYARDVRDTVAIHVGTVRAAAECWA